MQKYWKIQVLTLLILMVGALNSCNKKEQQKEGNETSAEPHIRKPVVTTLSLKPMKFDHFFEVQGRVKAEKDVLLVPEVGGRITALPVREGQRVKRGALIARFDNSVVNASVAELETQLENARFMYEKQKRLYDKGVGTEVALNAAETRWHALEKSIARVHTQKRKFALYAPFSGYIEKVFPVVGQIAGPPSPIVHLVNLHQLKVKATIAEVYLKGLKEGTAVNLFFPALDLTIRDLKINRIGRIVDPTNRTIDVEVNIPNPPSNLLPNLMAVLRVNDYSNPEAIAIPTRAVLKDFKDKAYVFVLEDSGLVKKHYVKLGKQYNNRIEVMSGLKPGDQLILRGARSIAEGDQVEVRNNNQ